MLTVGQAASIRAQVIFELSQLLGMSITAIGPDSRLIEDLHVDRWARSRPGAFRPSVVVSLPVDPKRYEIDELRVVVALPLSPEYCYHAPLDRGISQGLFKGPRDDGDGYSVDYEEHGFPQTVDSVITVCLIAAAHQLGRFERRAPGSGLPADVHPDHVHSHQGVRTLFSPSPRTLDSEYFSEAGFGLEVSEEVQKEIQAAARDARQRWNRAQEFLHGRIEG